jgi:hypothetical protein
MGEYKMETAKYIRMNLLVNKCSPINKPKRSLSSILMAALIIATVTSMSLPSKATASTPATIPVNPTVWKATDSTAFLVNSTANMQGLAYHDDFYYIGFDVGNNQGMINKYTQKGVLVKSSGPLPIGHSAELSFRPKDNHIYAANGGGNNPVIVYEVNMDVTKPYIVKQIDLSKLGKAALLGIDNDSDMLVIHSASSNIGNPTFSLTDFNGKIIKQFSVSNQGVPQGMEIYNKKIYFYTNNKITVIDYTGKITNIIKLPYTGESEGLAISGTKEKPVLSVGYNKPNRIYELK